MANCNNANDKEDKLFLDCAKERIISVTPTGLWAQRENDIDGEATGDRNVTSVNLSGYGTVLAIGATYNNSNGNRRRLCASLLFELGTL